MVILSDLKSFVTIGSGEKKAQNRAHWKFKWVFALLHCGKTQRRFRLHMKNWSLNVDRSINFTISPYASSTVIDGNLCWPTIYEQHINSVWNIIKVNCLRPAREFLRWLSWNINNITCVQYNRARSALQYCCWVRDQCLIWFYRHLILPRLSSL